ncbi:MAG TPA: hypothetical protein VMZ52_07360, partial [Bryobacteraceae bacterium]|nr:hypothetical protein [Bryobacteraceae bacterium]
MEFDRAATGEPARSRLKIEVVDIGNRRAGRTHHILIVTWGWRRVQGIWPDGFKNRLIMGEIWWCMGEFPGGHRAGRLLLDGLSIGWPIFRCASRLNRRGAGAVRGGCVGFVLKFRICDFGLAAILAFDQCFQRHAVHAAKARVVPLDLIERMIA